MLATLKLILRIDIEKEIIKADTKNFRIRHNVKKNYKLLHKYNFFNLSYRILVGWNFSRPIQK